MAEELQTLLDKINRDGVAKAQAEAAKILEAAKAEAAKLKKDAEAAAEATRATAKADAEAYANRAQETIRQALRDTVLGVEAAVTKSLEKTLVKDVNAALADPTTVKAFFAKAIEGLAGGEEVAMGETLRAQVAAEAATKGLTIITDETAETGFRVKLDGGRVEHDFTGATVKDALAKRLRADLAKLI